MQARILPGRGSGGRRRTSPSGSALALAARRWRSGRSVSNSSMMASIVACGVWRDGTAPVTLTTPRSVSTPGAISAPAVWNSTSFMVASLSASGPARALDLLRRVAERAEDPVVEPGPARFMEEVRVHELPHDLAVGGYLEQAPVAALADQRVAVGQTLGARDVRAEEVEERLVVVLPHDRARARVHLDHARVGRRVIAAVGPVVEDQEIAVGQRPRVVLLGQRRTAERPPDVARAAIDDDHGRDVAEADDQVAVGHLRDRVAVGPLPAAGLRRA